MDNRLPLAVILWSYHSNPVQQHQNNRHMMYEVLTISLPCLIMWLRPLCHGLFATSSVSKDDHVQFIFYLLCPSNTTGIQ